MTRKKGSSKGKVREEDSEEKAVQGKEAKYRSPEEAALQAVPDHLRVSSTRKSEEMLSNQMLSGIPEVDLGIEWVTNLSLQDDLNTCIFIFCLFL